MKEKRNRKFITARHDLKKIIKMWRQIFNFLIRIGEFPEGSRFLRIRGNSSLGGFRIKIEGNQQLTNVSFWWNSETRSFTLLESWKKQTDILLMLIKYLIIYASDTLNTSRYDDGRVSEKLLVNNRHFVVTSFVDLLLRVVCQCDGRNGQTRSVFGQFKSFRQVRLQTSAAQIHSHR